MNTRLIKNYRVITPAVNTLASQLRASGQVAKAEKLLALAEAAERKKPTPVQVYENAQEKVWMKKGAKYK